MKIAVSSQNRRTVTSHPGRCRRFWVYEVEGGEIQGKELKEIPREETLYENRPEVPEFIRDYDVLLVPSMGEGLPDRLARYGVRALITEEEDPDAAVEAFLKSAS
jgi:predicted Fe-Mo cluster-binding NifX family protein